MRIRLQGILKMTKRTLSLDQNKTPPHASGTWAPNDASLIFKSIPSVTLPCFRR